MLSPLAASLVQPVIKCISERGNRRAGRGYTDKIFLVPLHSLRNIDIAEYYNYDLALMALFQEIITWNKRC